MKNKLTTLQNLVLRQNPVEITFSLHSESNSLLENMVKQAGFMSKKYAVRETFRLLLRLGEAYSGGGRVLVYDSGSITNMAPFFYGGPRDLDKEKPKPVFQLSVHYKIQSVKYLYALLDATKAADHDELLNRGLKIFDMIRGAYSRNGVAIMYLKNNQADLAEHIVGLKDSKKSSCRILNYYKGSYPISRQ